MERTNKIKNETIKKLTRQEISDLGLFECGCYTYKGTLKQRVRGLKTTLKTENEVHFDGEDLRWEIIKIVPEKNRFNPMLEDEYCIRCFDKNENGYLKFYQVLIGCDFFK